MQTFLLLCSLSLSLSLSLAGGCCGSTKKRTIVGGWAWAWWLVTDVQRLSLNVMTLNPMCENVETAQGVPLTVTGVAQCKIMKVCGPAPGYPQSRNHSPFSRVISFALSSVCKFLSFWLNLPRYLTIYPYIYLSLYIVYSVSLTKVLYNRHVFWLQRRASENLAYNSPRNLYFPSSPLHTHQHTHLADLIWTTTVKRNLWNANDMIRLKLYIVF